MGTLVMYVADISFKHKINGVVDSAKSFIIAKMLEGF